jgi:hypothetical protein
MSKPTLDVRITTLEEESATVNAVFDSGSFFTVLREDKVPAGATVVRRKTPRVFRTAAAGGQLSVIGEVPLLISIRGSEIEDSALVSSELSQEMLIGAGTMQKWDISIVNRNGRTDVEVGRDLSDPDITEID